MSKAKVPLWQRPQNFAVVDTEATKGATVGVNLYWPGGAVVTEADLAQAAAAPASPVSRTMWSLVLQIPANVQAVAGLASAGFVRRDGVGAWTASPIVNADLSGCSTSGLEEGTNLYHTDVRVDARIALQKGAALGLATLGASGKLDAGQLPALSITETFVVTSEAAMLALAVQQGDVAVRSDLSTSYILTAEPASVLANWQELLAPTAGAVTSFNGRTGSVVPAAGDYTAVQVGADPAGTAAAVVAATVSSGAYAPVLTNGANVAASSAYNCQWMRVGGVVTVSGKVDITPTAASTATMLGISLPVASNFASEEQCGGTAAAPTTPLYAAGIGGDVVNNRANLQFVCGTDIANRRWNFSFTYRVV